MTTERWNFLTNHAHVLVCVANDPGARLRDTPTAVGITERAAHRILSQLVEAGYVVRERDGRRNRYEVKAERAGQKPTQVRPEGDLRRGYFPARMRRGARKAPRHGSEVIPIERLTNPDRQAAQP